MTAPLNIESASRLAAEIEKQWSDRSLAADVDGVLQLFGTDVIFFGSLPKMYLGHPGVREYLTSVDMAGARGIHWSDRQVRVLAPTVFTTSSIVVFDLMIGGQLAHWRFGITWTIVKQGDDWKIALHHASPRELKK